MQRKMGSAFGAFLIVAGFVWLVFDNLALGLIFGLFAAAAAGKAVNSSPPRKDRD
jgi:hypothetical protein